MEVVTVPVQLNADCIVKWRIEELDQLIIDLNNAVTDTLKEIRVPSEWDYTNIALWTLAKSIITMREVLHLTATGYSDGALGLSRNLYEQQIILLFFNVQSKKENFDQYVQNYYIDYDIQNYKTLIKQCEWTHCTDEVSIYNGLLSQVKKEAQGETKSFTDYWWTGKPNFYELSKYMITCQTDKELREFLEFLHTIYLRACLALHASCLGNMRRLRRNVEPALIDVLPSYDSQYFPLFFATSSLIPIVGISFDLINMDSEPYLNKLNELAIFYKSFFRLSQEG